MVELPTQINHVKNLSRRVIQKLIQNYETYSTLLYTRKELPQNIKLWSDSTEGKVADREFRIPGFESSQCHALVTHRDWRSWLNESENSVQTYVCYSRYIDSRVRFGHLIRRL